MERISARLPAGPRRRVREGRTNLAGLDAAGDDNEPDDDPRDGPHAGLVDMLVDHVEQVSDDAEPLVEDDDAGVNLEVLADRVVQRLERGFRPKELGRVCKMGGRSVSLDAVAASGV
jgi:hypothetical protein